MKIIIWDQNNQNNQDLKNTMSDGCSTVVQLVGLDGRVGWGREQIIVRFSKCSAAWQILPTTNCRPVCISFLCGWSQYILSHILNIFWSRILIALFCLIPLPVPNWASAEAQFIPNFSLEHPNFSLEHPNYSLSIQIFLWASKFFVVWILNGK